VSFNYHQDALSRLTPQDTGRTARAKSTRGWMERRKAANVSFGNRMGKAAYKGYHKGAAGAVKGFGRAAMTIPGGYMIAGGIFGAMSHDPTKNTFSSHMAQEGVKIGADIAFDMALFSTVGKMGAGGMAVALIGSIGAHTLGINPGSMMGSAMEGAATAYKKKQGGLAPITQNERTMRSMQQGMSLLGQSGRRHSMLGTEAQYMHN